MTILEASASKLASAQDFKHGMRQLAAGVNVITVSEGSVKDGLTATAACSISAEPPHLLICINASAGAHGPIHRVGAFCLNVLARNQEHIARRFAGLDGCARHQRFDIGAWTALATGAPVLEGALANFDCLVVREIAASTHTIFIGRVLEVRPPGCGAPLIYRDSQFAGVAELTRA